MVAPISPRQRAANQRNAQRSAGPTTDAGKARSAQNATTHGLTASAPALLPGEDPAEFAALERELLDDLRPRGGVQRQLARQVVWLTWKLNVRLPRCEAAAAAALVERPCKAWDQQVEIRRQRVFADSGDIERYARRNPRPPERGGPEAAAVELVDACQGVNHLGEPAKGRKGDDPLSKLEQLACRLRGNLVSLLRLYHKMREEGAEAEQAEEQAVEEAAQDAPAQNEPTSEPPKSGISDLKSQIPQSGAGTAPEMQNEPKPGERGSGQDVNGCAAPGGSGTVLSELRDREAAG